MASSIRIDKIVLSGFSAIENNITVELGPSFNLIYGTANDVKASICLAIEFMLSRSYEPKHVALSCLHPGVETKNYRAFVTLHLSSNEEFLLNGKKNKNFTVTRYLHANDGCNVYYGSDRNAQTEQEIEFFHTDLNVLNFIWLEDSLISQRIRPSPVEMNQMFINALGLTQILEDGNNVRQRHENDKIENEPLAKLVTTLKTETDKQRIFLTRLHTLELAILTKKISKLRAENPHALNCNGLSKNYDKCMLFAHVQSLDGIQQQEVNAFQRAIGQTPDISSKFSNDIIDLDALQDGLNGLFTTLNKYAEELKVECKEIWANEEENRMVAMRANLSEYFVEATGVSADDKAICQKSIDSAEYRLNATLGKSGKQEITVKIQNIMTDIENVVNAMNHPINSLNAVAQHYLDAKFAMLKQMKRCMECKERLERTDLHIKMFHFDQKIIHPAIFDAWEKGLSALTHKSAYDKGIPNGFKGNALDFIDIPANDADVVYVAAMAQYFATFFFANSSHAKAFEDIVESSFGKSPHLHICSINQPDFNQMNQLPYKSLADILLSAKTRSDHSFAKKWFDQFRVASANIDAETLQEEAVQSECTILCGRWCYRPDGSVWEQRHTPTNEIEEFHRDLKRCQYMRNEKIERHGAKFALDEELIAHTKTIADLEAQQSEYHFQISDSMSTISSGIAAILDLIHLSMEANDLELSQTVMLNVHRKQMQYFENGISNLEIGEMKIRESSKLNLQKGVIDTITKFEDLVATITNITINGKMPLLADATAKFEEDVNKMEWIPIDFPKELDMESPPQMMIDWNACLRSKILFRMEWELMHKVGCLEIHPEFIDHTRVEEYQQEEFQLCRLEESRDHLLERKPTDIVLPAFNVDVDGFNACCQFIEDNLPLLTDFTPDIKVNEIDIIGSGIYFHRLFNSLRILNEMIELPHGTGTVGVELSTPDETVNIFPNSPDQQLYRAFPLATLCRSETALRFITEMDSNSDLLDVDSNRYCALFRLAVSLSVHTSLIILNNSIIGMPSDEVQNIINWLQRRIAMDNQQVIVVQRSAVNSLQTNGLHLIHCSQDHTVTCGRRS